MVSTQQHGKRYRTSHLTLMRRHRARSRTEGDLFIMVSLHSYRAIDNSLVHELFVTNAENPSGS